LSARQFLADPKQRSSPTLNGLARENRSKPGFFPRKNMGMSQNVGVPQAQNAHFFEFKKKGKKGALIF
jgi:hypothetical protein